MAETAFGVSYGGPALEDGRMPVRDLAPALLSLGELFAEASLHLYPKNPPVALNIKATQEGSFQVDLILDSAASAWDQLVSIFGSDEVSALVNLKEAVIGGAGIFWLTVRMRGRRVEKEDPTVNAGEIRLELDDETSVVVPAETLALYRHVGVRKKAGQVVEPLKRRGVDQVEFREDTEVTVSIGESDVDAFDVPEREETPLLEQELELVVAIASVTFIEGNKWRFTDGERTFYAAIEDEVFLARVDRGAEAFRKGDMLRCRMRIVQSQRDDGLHTEYMVEEVIEHLPRPTQLELDPGQD